MIEANNDRKERTIRRLGQVNNLPTIPVVVFEVNKIIDDPDAGALEVARVISKDQGLVTKILTVANSPLYGIPRRVSTIDFAIVILGFNQVKHIVIALSMMESLKGFEVPGFDKKKYWIHSFMTATAAKRIVDDLRYSISGEAFTAGLLHDLGIMVIANYFDREFKEILALANSGSMSFEDAEVEILGLGHQEVGKFLIDKWNLPEELGDAVLNHHRPSAAKHKKLSSVVHLADHMTKVLEAGEINYDSSNLLDPGIIDILDLGNETYLEAFMQSYKELFLGQVESFNF